MSKMINEKTVKENTFSKRLQFFLRKKNQELKKQRKEPIDYVKLAEMVGYYEEDSFYNFLYRNKQPKDKGVIDKIAKVLDIPSIYIEQDTTRFWREVSRFEHLANDESFEDNGKDKKGKFSIYGNFDIIEYDNFIAAKEEFESHEFDDYDIDELIDEIKEKFYKMEVLECYKVTNYYNHFIKIHDNAWTFIVNFSLLNSFGRDRLKKAVLEMKTSIEHQLMNFDNIKVLFDIRDIKPEAIDKLFIEDFKKINTSIENSDKELMRCQLWSRLETNLLLEHWITIERFCRQVEHFNTIDFEDWTMLIGFFSLNAGLTYKPSGKQIQILTLSEELIIDKQYSDEADFIIKNF